MRPGGERERGQKKIGTGIQRQKKEEGKEKRSRTVNFYSNEGKVRESSDPGDEAAVE